MPPATSTPGMLAGHPGAATSPPHPPPRRPRRPRGKRQPGGPAGPAPRRHRRCQAAGPAPPPRRPRRPRGKRQPGGPAGPAPRRHRRCQAAGPLRTKHAAETDRGCDSVNRKHRRDIIARARRRLLRLCERSMLPKLTGGATVSIENIDATSSRVPEDAFPGPGGCAAASVWSRCVPVGSFLSGLAHEVPSRTAPPAPGAVPPLVSGPAACQWGRSSRAWLMRCRPEREEGIAGEHPLSFGKPASRKAAPAGRRWGARSGPIRKKESPVSTRSPLGNQPVVKLHLLVGGGVHGLALGVSAFLLAGPGLACLDRVERTMGGGHRGKRPASPRSQRLLVGGSRIGLPRSRRTDHGRWPSWEATRQCASTVQRVGDRVKVSDVGFVP